MSKKKKNEGIEEAVEELTGAIIGLLETASKFLEDFSKQIDEALSDKSEK